MPQMDPIAQARADILKSLVSQKRSVSLTEKLQEAAANCIKKGARNHTTVQSVLMSVVNDYNEQDAITSLAEALAIEYVAKKKRRCFSTRN